jgi:hypothetical protein
MSLERENMRRESIDDADSSKSTLPLKLGRELGLKSQSASYL